MVVTAAAAVLALPVPCTSASFRRPAAPADNRATGNRTSMASPGPAAVLEHRLEDTDARLGVDPMTARPIAAVARRPQAQRQSLADTVLELSATAGPLNGALRQKLG